MIRGNRVVMLRGFAISAICVMALAACSSGPRSGEPGSSVPNGVKYNGHTYVLTKTAEAWDAAQAEAASDGGYLAAVND